MPPYRANVLQPALMPRGDFSQWLTQMLYRAYCDLCHESYDSDNLMTCRSCDRDFCYHYGDSGRALCQQCLDKQRANQPSE